jgi:hypothetical protein
MKILQSIVIVFAITVTGAQAQSPAFSRRDALIGAWHLVRSDVPGADGKTAAPAHPPKGMLIYTRDGYVCAIDVSRISKRARQRVRAGRI